jgi:hypothetical protein
MNATPDYLAILAHGVALIACCFITGAVMACATLAAFGG